MASYQRLADAGNAPGTESSVPDGGKMSDADRSLLSKKGIVEVFDTNFFLQVWNPPVFQNVAQVKLLTDFGNASHWLWVAFNDSATVRDLKDKLQMHMSLGEEQHLIYDGKILQGEAKVEDIFNASSTVRDLTAKVHIHLAVDEEQQLTCDKRILETEVKAEDVRLHAKSSISMLPARWACLSSRGFETMAFPAIVEGV